MKRNILKVLILFCQYLCGYYTKKKGNGDFGRSYRHYMYQNKVCKSLDKFLEAIKDVEFKG